MSQSKASTEGYPSTEEPKAKAKCKTKSTRKNRVPSCERYDFDRQVGPDPRDSRTQGFPCYGNHQPMPEGRGSLSGRNGFAKWKVCEICRLRLEYTPTFGSPGTSRQAGPLPQDVATVVAKVKDKLPHDVEAKESLNNKTVGVLGAEASLRKKLEQIEKQKEQLKIQDRPTMAKATSPAAPASQNRVTEETKKASKREGPTSPEKQEAAGA